MSDGREVQDTLAERNGEVLVKETFDAESENTPELSARAGRRVLDG